MISKDAKEIIESLSAMSEAGELLAIVGPEVIGGVKPLLHQVASLASEFAPEVNAVRSKLIAFKVASKKQFFDAFIAEGFGREEALALTINSASEIANGVSKILAAGGGQAKAKAATKPSA